MTVWKTVKLFKLWYSCIHNIYQTHLLFFNKLKSDQSSKYHCLWKKLFKNEPDQILIILSLKKKTLPATAVWFNLPLDVGGPKYCFVLIFFSFFFLNFSFQIRKTPFLILKIFPDFSAEIGAFSWIMNLTIFFQEKFVYLRKVINLLWGYVIWLKNVELDRFSRFYVYLIQTNI